ncbi:glycosyltransferase family 2 protein [uncultured Parabacteroides sp.]|uniref:glycosyltransferase family 2 protein n=1 Tax=uncultured Parabacteroides sp. TaxID=512312 RepID=UPI0025D6DDCF|nr:glycosyltransferase family 2 protein [uncultured Parabacteroides sp.]
MEKTPFVSIIVPVFNVEKYLSQCLDSLLAQTLTNIEIICVNDCSTDGSLRILHEYMLKDERIVVIDLPENRKQGGARNAGIKQAKADFLGFVDSDDWVQSDMYEALYTAAEENRADMVCSDYYQYNSPEDVRLQINCDPDIFTLPLEERNKRILLSGTRLCTNILKKELFTENQLAYPEGLFYEDNAIASVLYVSANKIVKVNQPYYYYRCNNLSTTRGYNNYHFFDRLDTSKMFLDNMKRLGFYSKYKEAIDYKFTELFYVNTIFGAISQFTQPEYGWVDKVKKEMNSILPDFHQNIYYKARISFKTRFVLAIIHMHTGCGIKMYQFLKALKK